MFQFFQCEMKLIHQMAHLLLPYLLIFTRGTDNSGGRYRCVAVKAVNYITYYHYQNFSILKWVFASR